MIDHVEGGKLLLNPEVTLSRGTVASFRLAVDLGKSAQPA